ncbi:hypothetical protein M8C21_021607 [Ambrosia artemisiifolia]|uniref:Uncharacterized protein n=1 Tax=Ambrosia artemisiifolia TaxID=4212 RepID=A0AAD5GHA5_AMBAR|nr:hypothetical protein M8C21_021607 [Ambrosia artemisiifolia]
MSSKGRPLFDLNEPATEEEEDEESDGVFCFQPQRAIPSTTHTSDLFRSTNSPRRIVNNNAFSHAPLVSGFQPFIRSKGVQGSETNEEQKKGIGNGNGIGNGVGSVVEKEKEEGEWSDAEGSGMAEKSTSACDDDKLEVKPMVVLVDQSVSSVATVVNNMSLDVNDIKDEDSKHGSLEHETEGGSMPEKSTSAHDDDKSEVKPLAVLVDQKVSSVAAVINLSSNDIKDENSNHGSIGVDANSIDRKSSDSQEDSVVAPKQKEIKGVEAIHALKIANNPGKRPKIDQQREAMLGKKRSRQTMFLNLEDVKQAGVIKTSAPRRQNFPPPVTSRIVKDKQVQPSITKDSKQVDQSCNENSGSGSIMDSCDNKSECNNGDSNSGILGRPKKSTSISDLAAEDKPVTNHRQSVVKQTKNAQVLGRKTGLVSQNSIDSKAAGGKKLPSKKPSTVTTQYQDTSVERLLREVTNEKFWQHPGLKHYTSLHLLLNRLIVKLYLGILIISFCHYYCLL